MLRIRLKRVGRKNNPSYRVVLVEKGRSAQTGNIIENLGFYDPVGNVREFDGEAIVDWISKGAKPSGTVHNMLVDEKIIEGKKVNVLPRKSPLPKKEEAEAKEKPEEKEAETDKESAEVPESSGRGKADEAGEKDMANEKNVEEKTAEKKSQRETESDEDKKGHGDKKDKKEETGAPGEARALGSEDEEKAS